MSFTSLLGGLVAICSALTYGSADFFGGIATRRNNPYAVLTVSSSIGILPMLILAIVSREILPDGISLFWATFAGLTGSIGLMLLYYGLAHGIPVIVSPISGIFGAALPIVFAALNQQAPTPTQMAGFLVSFPAIYLVSQTSLLDRSSEYRSPISSLATGMCAGVLFGIFFISLAQIEAQVFFYPLAVSKSTALILGLVISLVMKQTLVDIRKNPFVLLAGILDPAANGLYLYSLKLTRLDIAAVLTSLYPAGTVILSFIFQKEKISKQQWVGLALCLVTIVLIMS